MSASSSGILMAVPKRSRITFAYWAPVSLARAGSAGPKGGGGSVVVPPPVPVPVPEPCVPPGVPSVSVPWISPI